MIFLFSYYWSVIFTEKWWFSYLIFYLTWMLHYRLTDTYVLSILIWLYALNHKKFQCKKRFNKHACKSFQVGLVQLRGFGKFTCIHFLLPSSSNDVTHCIIFDLIICVSWLVIKICVLPHHYCFSNFWFSLHQLLCFPLI